MKPIESDWKLYSKLIPFWRDRYLQVRNRELTAILSDDGKTPTEQFWQTKERMDEEAQVLNQCLGSHSRSKMWMSMLMMRRYGLIRDEDLNQFSEALRQDICQSVRVSGGV